MGKRLSVILPLIVLSLMLVSCDNGDGIVIDGNKYYIVTFKSYDESTLKVETVKKGEDATPPENPSRLSTNEYNYSFIAWIGNYQNVNKNEIVISSFETEVRQYSVRFINPDGMVISSNKVAFGNSVVPPTNSQMDGYDDYSYKFVEWIGNYNSIANDMDIIAKYDKYQTVQLTLENYKNYFLIEEEIVYDLREEYNSSVF